MCQKKKARTLAPPVNWSDFEKTVFTHTQTPLSLGLSWTNPHLTRTLFNHKKKYRFEARTHTDSHATSKVKDHNPPNTMTCDSSMSSSSHHSHHSHGGTGSELQFPGKLHNMMEYVEREGYDNIVSWVNNGQAIMVHDPKKILDLLPKFFSQTKFRSFQRQLNMWHFERILKGPTKGAFRHPLFRRDNKNLCSRMSRNINDNQWKLQGSNPILSTTTTMTTVGGTTTMSMDCNGTNGGGGFSNLTMDTIKSGCGGGVAPTNGLTSLMMLNNHQVSSSSTSCSSGNHQRRMMIFPLLNMMNNPGNIFATTSTSGGVFGDNSSNNLSSSSSSSASVDCLFDNDALASVLDTAESLLVNNDKLVIDDDFFDDDDMEHEEDPAAELFEGRRFHMVDGDGGGDTSNNNNGSLQLQPPQPPLSSSSSSSSQVGMGNMTSLMFQLNNNNGNNSMVC